MSFLSRLGRAVRGVVARVITRPSRQPPPPYEPGPGGGGPIIREPERESRLPEGWVLVGLYHEGEKTQRIFATDDTEVTDSDIHGADALIVWYQDAGDDGYRWVHGATGWDSLDDQVSRTIVIVSPTGRGD